MAQEIILAGFGGQGIMLAGKLLTYTGMLEGKNVTWLPSYGPEMRGGTANCTVIISDEEIGSPIVTNPSVALVFNNPSLEKFEPLVKTGGTLIVNTSLVTIKSKRTDINIINIPANDIAIELGEVKITNMVMMGAFVAATKAVSFEGVMDALKKTLPAHRQNLLPLNEKALKKGSELV